MPLIYLAQSILGQEVEKISSHRKYDKYYRSAKICIAVAVAAFAWIVIAAAALFISPTDPSILGLSRMTTTVTLFFVPTMTGAALMMGMNYWFIAEYRAKGLYGLSENKETVELQAQTAKELEALA